VLKLPWSLSYLEPDIVIMKNELEIIVDAKYKSHLFNLKGATEELKEEHRKDCISYLHIPLLRGVKQNWDSMLPL
jgi:5-methylcytosine-specific restriction endonuclease McrBC regulatory subunit McrC